MQTVKLYDENPYETCFEAAVREVSVNEKAGAAAIVLDRTLFFPEEGGQTPDTGVLAGLPVTDVQIRNGVIIHTVRFAKESPVPREGATVSGTIDWTHRFSNMQNHTGEHILSGLLHSLYGYENVGFRLSDNTVTLDTGGQLDDAQLCDLERRANEVIYRNVKVTCEYPPEEVLQKLAYRSKKELPGPVRIVTIDGVDVCACCAPHVRRTGEIGLIRIIDVLHTKTNMRLTIVCGSRALEYTQHSFEQLRSISRLTNMPKERAADGVQRLLDEIAQQKETLRNLENAYIDKVVAAADGAGTPAPAAMPAGNSPAGGLSEAPVEDSTGKRDLWLFENALSTVSLRNLMNRLCDLSLYRYVGVFTGSEEEGYKYFAGGRGADARLVSNTLKELPGGRGGGKPEMVQGSVKAGKDAILAALRGIA